MAKTLNVPCPQCGKAQAWSSTNPWRPFCSERCKKIDLGAWASEEYRVPAVGPGQDGLPDDEGGPA